MTRGARLALWLAVVGALLAGREASAEPSSDRHPTYAAVGVGGYLALTGPGELGPAAELELYPARWGRFGVRAAYYGLDADDLGAALLTSGLTYQAAASRPHLHLALHADLAIAVGDADGTLLGAGGGVQSQLWVLGPVALGLDVTAHLLANRDVVTLALTSATTLRLSF